MKKCTVIAASNMSEETFAYLCDKIKRRFGGDLEIERVVDDSVIGGCVIDLAGHIFDLSVKTQLAELSRHMHAGDGDCYG